MGPAFAFVDHAVLSSAYLSALFRQSVLNQILQRGALEQESSDLRRRLLAHALLLVLRGLQPVRMAMFELLEQGFEVVVRHADAIVQLRADALR